MGREEKLLTQKSRIQDGLGDLSGMGKEDLIKKCCELAATLDKANDDATVNNMLLKQLYSEYEKLKTKTNRIDQSEYNKGWSWVNKIVFALKKINRPLLSSEIIEFMTPHEQVLKHSRYPAQAFSAHLHKAVRYGRVLAYKLGGCRGYYYILPEWADATGMILKEYENKIFFR